MFIVIVQEHILNFISALRVGHIHCHWSRVGHIQDLLLIIRVGHIVRVGHIQGHWTGFPVVKKHFSIVSIT